MSHGKARNDLYLPSIADLNEHYMYMHSLPLNIKNYFNYQYQNAIYLPIVHL